MLNSDNVIVEEDDIFITKIEYLDSGKRVVLPLKLVTYRTISEKEINFEYITEDVDQFITISLDKKKLDDSDKWYYFFSADRDYRDKKDNTYDVREHFYIDSIEHEGQTKLALISVLPIDLDEIDDRIEAVIANDLLTVQIEDSDDED